MIIRPLLVAALLATVAMATPESDYDALLKAVVKQDGVDYADTGHFDVTVARHNA